MTVDLLSIGQVADAVNMSVSAVRYYDKIGLISAEKRVGGQRRYVPETPGRVSFVQRAKDAGFSLDEIAEILEDEAGGWHDLVDSKLDELKNRRARLDVMIEVLTMVRACGCEAAAECPRFETSS